MAIQYDRTSPVLNNTNVDNIVDQPGEIDQLASLSLDMPDRNIIRNLNQRITDSESYWNDAQGYDLKNARSENTRLHLGKTDETGLYKHQKQYKENQIFVSEESIVSYVTNQIAGPLVIPAGPEDMYKTFASNLEKAINCYCEEVVSLESLAELWTRDILNKRIAVGHFYYDKTLDDIILEHVDPDHIILDKNAALGKNPGFICHVLKRTPEELINEFPKREKDILDHFGIQRKTPKQMTREIAIRKVWVTHYNKKNEPEEGVVWYFDNIVLEKMRNPNYLYARKDLNLLRFPKKPYIFGNLVNYGTHLIDNTTPLEQAADMQKYLMRRGRQIAENADKANGILVIGTSSGLTKDDGQNITGDPNQKLFVDNDDGKGLSELVMQLQAQMLPDYVIKDKLDARIQIGNLMGAPTDFTGADNPQGGDATLGEVIIKKNAASGRQDMMVRSITRMIGQVYEYLVQMMVVWYDKSPRTFTYDAGDGDFEFITIKRDLIHKGIRVKASKPANPDRSRIEAIALQLLKAKAISLLDAYKILQLDNAQQLYDNWAKQQADPTALARDALDIVDETDAYVAFIGTMNGEKPDVPPNVSKEYILSLRKLMINGTYINEKGESIAFLDAKPALQGAFVKFVNQCIDNLEQRLQLEEASQVAPDAESLRPGAPLPSPMMPQPGGVPGQPPMPPAGGMMPQPQLPPMNGMPAPMPAAPPMMPPMMPPTGPTPSGVFSNVPVPSPGQSLMPQPGNPGALPMS